MPVSPKYPGVYIEEIPSGVRTITGVSTATTAFVGRARKGPVNTPTIIHSYAEYERIFGGLWLDSTMSVALNQYFANGGGEAVIVRVFDPLPVPLASFVQWNLPGLPGNLAIVAASPGSWARDPDNLHLKVDTNTKAAGLYNITVQRGPDPAPPAPAPPPLEVIRIATLNGATYLGRADRIGSLAVGKRADLVLLDGDLSRDVHVITRPLIVFRNVCGFGITGPQMLPA